MISVSFYNKRSADSPFLWQNAWNFGLARSETSPSQTRPRRGEANDRVAVWVRPSSPSSSCVAFQQFSLHAAKLQCKRCNNADRFADRGPEQWMDTIYRAVQVHPGWGLNTRKKGKEQCYEMMYVTKSMLMSSCRRWSMGGNAIEILATAFTIPEWSEAVPQHYDTSHNFLDPKRSCGAAAVHRRMEKILDL
jgi:hypothetical protein